MRVVGIDHIGIVVNDIEQSIIMYKTLFGIEHIRTVTLTEQGTKIAILQGHNLKIELLESANENSKIAKFIKSRGTGMHHLAFQVEHLQEFIRNIGKQDIKIIDGIKKGENMCDIAFIHPKQTENVLIELCQKPR
ncbi:VOC family protein [Desulfuribacillus alkaliarsenatis]|uniref:VOC domain-containing protein n=1 Tax=Desulfuribacillus alkaliarsenatis TaxID=766136 RepID=A0A1E5G5M1_9FIRM|nr:VOC family protein [Desulfuribacillus alkaliarsenatis]OEF98466.1 hypothetical protein BHF68_01970 [Desulfuribacillus alkaliarsenatis]